MTLLYKYLGVSNQLFEDDENGFQDGGVNVCGKRGPWWLCEMAVRGDHGGCV